MHFFCLLCYPRQVLCLLLCYLRIDVVHFLFVYCITQVKFYVCCLRHCAAVEHFIFVCCVSQVVCLLLETLCSCRWQKQVKDKLLLTDKPKMDTVKNSCQGRFNKLVLMGLWCQQNSYCFFLFPNFFYSFSIAFSSIVVLVDNRQQRIDKNNRK